jgi:PST family polysaccharide transporter
VLGVEAFGLLSFVLAVIAYGMILTDYGFDLSATKLISVHRDEREKLEEIFSAVITIKLLLALLYFLIILLLTLTVDKFAAHALLYYLAFGMVLGEVFFPAWFFQGVEQMRYITIIKAGTKIFFTLMLFLTVRGPEDLALVPALNSLGAMAAAVIAFGVVKKRFGIRWRAQTAEKLRYYLIDGWYIFTSRIAVELYMTSNVIILGFFASDRVVGHYAVVEKSVRALARVLDPVTRTVYPYLANLHKSSVADFYRRNLQLSLLIVLLMLPVSVVVYLYAPQILHLVAGKDVSEEMVRLLHIFTLILPFSLFGSQYTNMLVTLNETKLLNRIVFVAGIANIFLAITAIHFYGAVGLAWTNVIILYGIYVSKGYFTLWRFRRRDLKNAPRR